MMTIILDGFEVLIDEEDLALVSQYRWYINKSKIPRKNHRYFRTQQLYNPKPYIILLHRLIMGCVCNDGLFIDHINCNPFDCRKENLRICTPQQSAKNCRKYSTNTSGYKGVCWNRKRVMWEAQISVNNKHIHLGFFKSRLTAYAAYCEASKKYHKEFGRIE
jgi:hypothetical protein